MTNQQTATHFSHPSFGGLVGVARQDITPPVGIYSRLWGAAEHDVAEGVHRPLLSTVMTLQSGPEAAPLVLAGLDLGWWQNLEDEWRVRGRLIEQLKLDPQRVMVCASHTHGGPSTNADCADKPGGHLIVPYLEILSEVLLSSTRSALQNSTEAIITWQYGCCEMAHNRDLPDPDAPRVVCGFHPSGPDDDTLLVGRVNGLNGAPIATIVNYACHPTTLAWENRLISPDYVGAMREVVEGNTCCPCLFLQGASGELAPREQHQGSVDVADKNGRELGWAVLATLEGMLPTGQGLQFAGTVESGASLATWKRTPHQPAKILEAESFEVEVDLKDLPSLSQIDTDLNACHDRVLAERLWRKRGVRRKLGEGSSSRQLLWIWRVGDVILIGQSNEAYSCFQRQLRQRFKNAPIAVIGLVNGSCGYLPPARLYDSDIYQVWQSPFARGSLERVMDACRKKIDGMLGR